MKFTHQRFEPKIKKEPTKNGCWLWAGAKNKDGYGKMAIGSRVDGTRKFVSAHRYSYRFYVGPIPEGEVVFQCCRNHSCVNPHHLRVGTQSKNIKSAVKAGRWIRQKMRMIEWNKTVDLRGIKNPNYRHGRCVRREDGTEANCVSSGTA